MVDHAARAANPRHRERRAVRDRRRPRDRRDVGRGRGDALLVWGEFADDGLRSADPARAGVALDALHAAAEQPDSPQTLRLWSTKDDQLFAVIYGDQCAIYVVESATGYGTSAGNPTRNEAFELTDDDAGALTVPWSDCVPWDAARTALMRFAETGELGDRGRRSTAGSR